MVLLAGYRLYVSGGIGFYATLAVALFLLAVIPLLQNWYDALGRMQKVVSAVCIAAVTYLIVMAAIWFCFFYLDQLSFLARQPGEIFLGVGLAYMTAMALSVLLIENISENRRVQERARRLVDTSLDTIGVSRN